MANMIWPSAWVFKTTLTSNSATALEQLWAIREETDTTNGTRVFKYVQYTLGSTAAAANWTVAYRLGSATDATWNTVTNDVSDSDINAVAWVFVWAVTEAYYGWLQVWGYHSVIATNADDDISAWDVLIWGWDGTCNSVAQDTAPTNTILWVALADDVNADDTVAWNITVWA